MVTKEGIPVKLAYPFGVMVKLNNQNLKRLKGEKEAR
jgi:hypothetical protein